jgi:hypothetical protein
MAHTTKKQSQFARSSGFLISTSGLGDGGIGGNVRFISLVLGGTLQQRLIIRSPLVLFGPYRKSGFQE